MTTPPSAIFWSRPRTRYPPHGDNTANYKGEQGLRARAHPWRGGLAERDASCMLHRNSLLGALTQAPIPTAAHADTSQFKSKARKVADVV